MALYSPKSFETTKPNKSFHTYGKHSRILVTKKYTIKNNSALKHFLHMQAILEYFTISNNKTGNTNLFFGSFTYR